VRLGATAVVRLEGALAHEYLRLLASAHRGESAPHPMVGFCWSSATAIGRPVELRQAASAGVDPGSTRRRSHGHAKAVADTLGQRYGSAGRPVKPAQSDALWWCTAAGASRHADDHAICGGFGCGSLRELLGFRLSRSRPLLAQAVDKRVDNRAGCTGQIPGEAPHGVRRGCGIEDSQGRVST
jgi:hypothetical protein